MKKVLLGLTLVLGINCFSQQKSKVQKVNGIEVYLLAEPVREYKVLKTSGKGIQWGSLLTYGLVNESISDKVTNYIKKLAKHYKDRNIEFDAVMYSHGKQMTAIKFSELKTEENDRIATVHEIEGIPVYVMSTPISDYKYIKTIKGGIKWKSALTAGLLNNSIEEDLLKFKNKMNVDSKKKQMSAIIYERGKSVDEIKLAK